MINEEKVRSMTSAALYEKGEQRKNIEICRYFRSDYIGVQMIKSAIAYLVAFCGLVLLWFLRDSEAILLKLSQPVYLQGLLKMLAVLAVAGLLIYEIGVYFCYAVKYDRASKSIEHFHESLKDIQKFYEAEESAEEYTVINLSDEENEL